MRQFLAICMCLAANSAIADVVMPVRTIRPGAMISEADLVVKSGNRPGTFDRVSDVAGQEARTALYAGRPIAFDAIGPPALVDRNQIVTLHFAASGVVITTDGRALERGGIGDRVRIMNLSSRSTLFGFVQADGTVKVTQ